MKNKNSELINRDDIPDKYKWNLIDLFDNDKEWYNEYSLVEQKFDKIANFKGSLLNSEQNLIDLIRLDEDINIRIDKLHLYSFLSKDLDLSNSTYQIMADKIQNLHTKYLDLSSFIRPEILKADKNKFLKLVSNSKELKIYTHHFQDLFRSKKHILSAKEEKILSLSSHLSQFPYQTFTYLKNVDIIYPKIKDENNKEIQISEGRFYSALFNKNRDYRKRVYKAYYEPIISHKHTLTSLFASNIKSSIFSSNIRNFESTRQAALHSNNIPESVYDNLINTVNDNLSTLHKWVDIKRKLLKLDKLNPYDTYVSIFDGPEKEYTYEEGINIVKNSLKCLGKEYNKALNYAFDNRWIDVYETKNKRGGAYSSGTTFNVHPYVLLNWNFQLNDVSTLTHEMGHNMHSYFTGKNQPFVYADYSIFLAEVASITNEALLMNYLIENAKTKKELQYLIEMYLNKIVTTFYRQTRFAEFEYKMHRHIEKQGSITSDYLCEEYGQLYKKYWGEHMIVDEEETYTWARVPHFYYGFYVYQYATGLAAGEYLASKILENPDEGVKNLMNFLKAGKSDYSINILKNAGIDMTSKEPINSVILKMKKLLNKLENLI